MKEDKSGRSLEFLPFDTEIFEIKYGKLNILDEIISMPELNNILKRAESEKSEHLVVKASTEQVITCNLLEDSGFRRWIVNLVNDNSV